MTNENEGSFLVHGGVIGVMVSAALVYPAICLSYTDIVTHQYLGDRYSKVLRVVALDSSPYTSYVNKIYDAPHYIPLERNNIETIDIDIRDDRGNPAQFDGGTVITKLHFRKKFF